MVRLHERRTGIKVAVERGTVPDQVTPAVKICAYRFIQEGLNNAFRHAGADGQSIACGLEGSVLVLTVRDKGGTNTLPAGSGSGLGLVGLRERVESLGGTFRVERRRGGTVIEMRLPITEETQDG